jgi:hypothetical protein
MKTRLSAAICGAGIVLLCFSAAMARSEFRGIQSTYRISIVGAGVDVQSVSAWISGGRCRDCLRRTLRPIKSNVCPGSVSSARSRFSCLSKI